MRYHFIDKIRSIEKGKSIVTVKNVTVSEDFFADHFVGYPVMPGALQIEAIAQAAGALIEISSGYKTFSILLMVEKMKFKRMIHPGDQMVITINIISQDEGSAMVESKIEVDSKVMTVGRMMVGLIGKNNDKMDVTKMMNLLEEHYRFLLRDTEYISS